MTEHEMDVAVAELCGWIKLYEEGDDEGCGRWLWHRGDRNVKRLPNYCGDSNAMRDALSILNRTDGIAFISHLLALINDVDEGYHNKVGWDDAWDIAKASPKLQAVAFLKVKGKL